jgi:hypothetical protein
MSANDLPEPKEGDRICEACEPRVALVVDLSRPGCEYRCPKCGAAYEEWFGLRYLPANSEANERTEGHEGNEAMTDLEAAARGWRTQSGKHGGAWASWTCG